MVRTNLPFGERKKRVMLGRVMMIGLSLTIAGLVLAVTILIMWYKQIGVM